MHKEHATFANELQLNWQLLPLHALGGGCGHEFKIHWVHINTPKKKKKKNMHLSTEEASQ